MADVVYTGVDGSKGAVPAGTVVAGAHVSGAVHQYVKVEFGASDTAATKVSTADPLPVTLSTAVPVLVSAASTDPLSITAASTAPVPVLVSTGTPVLLSTASVVTLSTGSVATLSTGSVVTLSTGSVVTLGAAIVADPTPPSTGTITSLSASTSTGAQTVLAANATRKGATIYRDIASGLVCVKLGTSATTAAYSLQLAQGALYELPAPAYTGALTAIVITTSTAGALHITELT